MSTHLHAFDLTQRPPRSPRVRLGGYALLPRLLDKLRASLAGTLGEYHPNCPLDQQFLNFTGVDFDALSEQVAKGLGDGDLLAWITTHQSHPRDPWEIAAWSDYQESRTPPSDPEVMDFFQGLLRVITTARSDILSWADLLDLDDYASFGGKP